MPGLLDYLFGSNSPPPPAAAPTSPASQDWATSLLNDPATQGLLDVKLPPMQSDQARVLRSVSAGLGNVAKTMAGIGASGRRVPIGAVLGAAGGAFGEGLTDIEAERYKDILQRYQLAKQRGDLVAQRALASEYLDMKKQIDAARAPGGGGAAPAAGPDLGLVAPPNTTGGMPPSLAGGGGVTLGPIGGGGAGGTAGPPGAAGAGADPETGQPMITLASGTKVPLAVAQSWLTAGSPEAFQEAKKNYLEKIASKDQWVTLSPEQARARGYPTDKGQVWQYNLNTGKVDVADKSTKVDVGVGATNIDLGKAYEKPTTDLIIENNKLLSLQKQIQQGREQFAKTPTGAIAGDPIVQRGRKLLDALGWGGDTIKKDATAQEAAEAVAARLVTALGEIGAQAGGRMSPLKIQNLKDQIPNLLSTPEGAQAVFDQIEAMVKDVYEQNSATLNALQSGGKYVPPAWPTRAKPAETPAASAAPAAPNDAAAKAQANKNSAMLQQIITQPTPSIVSNNQAEKTLNWLRTNRAINPQAVDAKIAEIEAEVARQKKGQ